jgi:Transglycosylase SLT domain/SPOR domain
VRATGPYSIGALTGKGMHDACRRRALGGVARQKMALAALVLCLNGRAYADAGPETDNALATLCGIVEASAKAEGLPTDFFTKLIWRESSFRPNAVSPAGAQGVAQFMPGTASERGLIDPFDPASAIPASAKFIGELKRRFGNLGLAAAAYNAGETAVANWLANKGSLPFETQDYVLAITGHDAEEWRSEKPPAASAPSAPAAVPASTPPASTPAAAPPAPSPSCLTLVATLRVTAPSSGVVSGWFAPWGVQIAASFSKGAALRAFARAKHQYASVIGDMNPFVLGSVLRSRGWRPFYRVRLPAQTGGEARKLCDRIQAVGGACAVLRS